MLKVLSSSSSRFYNQISARTTATVRHGTVPTTPLLRLLNSINRSSSSPNPNLYCLRYLCSNSSDGSDAAADAKAAEGESLKEAESKSSASIVPTVFKPDECFQVLALPLVHRPLFPGFYMPIYVKDPKLLEALIESRKRQAPYAGAFLVKDDPESVSASSSETEKNIFDLKGKDLLNRLHEVGTLAQITSIQGDQVVLIGHRRLRITEMVCENPLIVKVDHLKITQYYIEEVILSCGRIQNCAWNLQLFKSAGFF